jgi:oligopeptide transport system substrate-binding protein
MMKHVIRVGIACAFAGLISFAGCDQSSDASGGKGGSSAAAAGEKSFTFINRGDIITLDTNQMSYLQDFRITYALREGLFSYDPSTPTFEPLPALAAETTTSDDKLTWTFKLRDAKWTNGDPVTAQDFVFSWRLMLESPGEYTYLFYYFKNAEAYEKAYQAGNAAESMALGFEALDENTLKLTLNNPVPFLPDLLAFPTFYPRHARSMEPFKVNNNGKISYEAKYTLPENVVTNGPFKFEKWEQGKRLVLRKNPGYWNAAEVKSDVVEMIVNNDPQSAFVQYEGGKVDWLADVSAEIGAKLKEKGRKDLRVSPSYGTAFLTFNVAESVANVQGKNPLSDIRVRKALAMSIDKQYIVDKITRMGERPAYTYVPQNFFPGYSTEKAPQLNMEEAKSLLAEAGYEGGKGFPTLTIMYNSDNPTRKAFSEYISQSWKNNLGINIELTPLEVKTYRTQVTTKQYSIACVAWYGDYMDLSTWTDKYLSTSQNNDTNWGPKAYDELCAAAAKEPDEQKRLQLLAQAESMINSELPIVPLYYYVNVTLHRDNVKGIIPNAKNILVWKDVIVER